MYVTCRLARQNDENMKTGFTIVAPIFTIGIASLATVTGFLILFKGLISEKEAAALAAAASAEPPMIARARPSFLSYSFEQQQQQQQWPWPWHWQ